MACTEHEHRDSHEVQHDRRDVHHVVGPIAPAGQETMKIAEDLFGPEVHATFTRITMREFDHGDSLGPEEKYQRDDPQPYGDTTVGGNGGDDVQIKYGDDEKQDEVPPAKNAAQMRCFRDPDRSGNRNG